MSVNSRGDVSGRADAIGPQEQLDIVIEDEKTALQGHNGYFLAANESGELKALSSKAKEKEIFRLRTDFVNRLVACYLNVEYFYKSIIGFEDLIAP